MAEIRPDMMRGLAMEKLFGHALIDEFTARPTQLLPNLAAVGSFSWLASPGAPYARQGWGALEARVGRLIVPDQTIKRHMDSFYDEMIRRADMPACDADWRGDWEERMVLSIPTWNVLARMLLPSLTRANELV